MLSDDSPLSDPGSLDEPECELEVVNVAPKVRFWDKIRQVFSFGRKQSRVEEHHAFSTIVAVSFTLLWITRFTVSASGDGCTMVNSDGGGCSCSNTPSPTQIEADAAKFCPNDVESCDPSSPVNEGESAVKDGPGLVDFIDPLADLEELLPGIGAVPGFAPFHEEYLSLWLDTDRPRDLML